MRDASALDILIERADPVATREQSRTFSTQGMTIIAKQVPIIFKRMVEVRDFNKRELNSNVLMPIAGRTEPEQQT